MKSKRSLLLIFMMFAFSIMAYLLLEDSFRKIPNADLNKLDDLFKEKKLTFTGLLDPKGKVAKQFKIASIPTTLIVDKKGRVIGAAVGPRAWDKKTSINMFKHLVAME